MPSYLATAAAVIAASSASALADPLVDATLPNGSPIQGTASDKAVTFIGVPYGAEPERWTEASLAAAWTDTLVADTPYAACPQTCTDGKTLPTGVCPTDFSEDCLALNIYAPLDWSPEDSRDVLYFIHGGNFVSGDGYGGPAHLYDGTYIANSQGAIVVTVNYRLGAFGNMYSADGDMPGNLALSDQRLGMQWVQDNIAAFGGDPTSVTIAGQSAGAMSVGSHLVMDAAEGLFSQAFLFSDPFAIRFRTTDEWDSFAETIAKKADCTKGLVTKKVDGDCMRDLSWEDLVDAQDAAESDIVAELSNLIELFSPFTPVYGAAGLDNRPLELFQAGLNKDIPTVMGTTASEGFLFVDSALTSPVPAWEIKAAFEVLFGKTTAEGIFDLDPVVCDETDDGSEDCRDWASAVATQTLFDCPTRNATASAKSTSGDKYVYHFDWELTDGAAIWGEGFTFCVNNPGHDQADGGLTCHGGELPLAFRPSQLEEFGFTITDEEEALSASFQSYLGNFLATGNPGTVGDVAWPAWTSDSKQTIHFNANGNTVDTEWQTDMCDFLDSQGYFWY